MRPVANCELAVPADLSVVGFDDNPISRLLDPALTAVGWDTPGAATAAAAMLSDAIEGRPPRPQIVIEPRLEVRASTGPHRHRASSTLPNFPGAARYS